MVAIEQKNKLHPHKFTLMVAIGSMIMMFGGFTSAYIVKRNQPKWQTFELPAEFWFSTIAIIASSITVMLAVKAFKARQMPRYRTLMLATLLLGIAFVILQYMGFVAMYKQGFTLQASASYAFLYVIVGLHALHVLGGVVALAVLTARAYSPQRRNYSSIPVEVAALYWHFVDGLWICLLYTSPSPRD